MIPGWDPNFASLRFVSPLAITHEGNLSSLHVIVSNAANEVF
jgi:hypothetical protein